MWAPEIQESPLVQQVAAKTGKTINQVGVVTASTHHSLIHVCKQCAGVLPMRTPKALVLLVCPLHLLLESLRVLLEKVHLVERQLHMALNGLSPACGLLTRQLCSRTLLCPAGAAEVEHAAWCARHPQGHIQGASGRKLCRHV
jgi:hypothetical protein